MTTQRVEVYSCDGPACPAEAWGGEGWLQVAVQGTGGELDFCGWDCLINHAIATPDLARASGESG